MKLFETAFGMAVVHQSAELVELGSVCLRNKVIQPNIPPIILKVSDIFHRCAYIAWLRLSDCGCCRRVPTLLHCALGIRPQYVLMWPAWKTQLCMRCQWGHRLTDLLNIPRMVSLLLWEPQTVIWWVCSSRRMTFDHCCLYLWLCNSKRAGYAMPESWNGSVFFTVNLFIIMSVQLY